MLEPAEIDRASHTKRIAVSQFKNDREGLSGKIESNIAKQRLDGKYYFTTVSRSDIDKVLKEQKFQYSGVLEDSQAVEVGELIGAQAIISGEVTNASSSDSSSYEERMECADKDCKKLRTYQVYCTTRSISMGASIKMTDVAKGDIIYADSFSPTRRWKHCQDDSNALPSRAAGLDVLANYIAQEFVYKLTPHYKTVSVELLEDPDIKYDARQKKTLEVALDYIEAGRMDKAEQLLGTLLESTQEQSYVAAYNLGVVMESQGKLKEAQRLYQMADKLQLEPVEQINDAVLRIRETLYKHEKAMSQISK